MTILKTFIHIKWLSQYVTVDQTMTTAMTSSSIWVLLYRFRAPQWTTVMMNYKPKASSSEVKCWWSNGNLYSIELYRPIQRSRVSRPLDSRRIFISALQIYFACHSSDSARVRELSSVCEVLRVELGLKIPVVDCLVSCRRSIWL